MDSCIGHFLLTVAGMDVLDRTSSPPRALPFVVHSTCDFLRPMAYPAVAHVGISVTRLGSSSVTYRCAVFDGDEIAAVGIDHVPAAAVGLFIHVWVDRTSERPVADMGTALRAAYEKLQQGRTTSE